MERRRAHSPADFPVSSTNHRPKYTPTATAMASKAKMSWRSESPKNRLLIIPDFFVDAYFYSRFTSATFLIFFADR